VTSCSLLVTRNFFCLSAFLPFCLLGVSKFWAPVFFLCTVTAVFVRGATGPLVAVIRSMRLALALLTAFVCVSVRAEVGIGGGGINSNGGGGTYRITGVGGVYNTSTFPTGITSYGRGGIESAAPAAQINTRPAYVTVIGNTIVTGVGGITTPNSY